MNRTVARLAAVGGTAALTLGLTAGVAAAGGDERCQRADGAVVCLPADVNAPITVGDVDVDVLTDLIHGHHHG